MTCSCQFSAWFKEWAASFGSAAPFIMLGLLLLWWGIRQVRREHFAQANWRIAFLVNYPAMILLSLGTLVILATLTMSLL